MHELNDLYYFPQVVDHGGFAPAERALSWITPSVLGAAAGLVLARSWSGD